MTFLFFANVEWGITLIYSCIRINKLCVILYKFSLKKKKLKEFVRPSPRLSKVDKTKTAMALCITKIHTNLYTPTKKCV